MPPACHDLRDILQPQHRTVPSRMSMQANPSPIESSDASSSDDPRERKPWVVASLSRAQSTTCH